MIVFQCPECGSRYIKEVMYEDYGTLHAMLECEECGAAGEYSYFDIPKNNKSVQRTQKAEPLT